MSKVLQPGEGVRQRSHVITEKEDGKSVEYFVRSGVRSKITKKFYDRRKKTVMIEVEREKLNVKFNDGRDHRDVKLTRRFAHPDPEVQNAAREKYENSVEAREVKI